MESQLPFGLEKLTPQELAFAWMATLVRPNSVLAHLRSHAISQGNIEGVEVWFLSIREEEYGN